MPCQFTDTPLAIGYAIGVPLFIVSGQLDLFPLQQALAGLLLTAATAIIALRLPPPRRMTSTRQDGHSWSSPDHR